MSFFNISYCTKKNIPKNKYTVEFVWDSIPTICLLIFIDADVKFLADVEWIISINLFHFSYVSWTKTSDTKIYGT